MWHRVPLIGQAGGDSFLNRYNLLEERKSPIMKRPSALLLILVPLLGLAPTRPAPAQTVEITEKPKAGPGVPAPARTEEISTVQATTFSDGSQVAKSKLELRSIPPARVQNRVVIDAGGSTVATVERVIEDPAGKGIRFLVLSNEEHQYIVPAGAFTLGERDHELTLQLAADPAKLANAPIYVEARAADYFNRDTAQPVYSYWNVAWED
jgi:hypothetical protein